jgi:uncharacterized membrane protein
MSTRASITVRRPRGEVYRRWREYITQPDGAVALREVEIIDERPEGELSFRSDPSADTLVDGVARFVEAVAGRGTEIHLELDDGSTGKLGATAAKLMGDKSLEPVKDDLRRFRQLLEVGEVVRSDATADARTADGRLLQRAAQPAEHAHI